MFKRCGVVAGMVLSLSCAAVPVASANEYQANGQIVHDSGLRPDQHGYSFENYDNAKNPQNLGPNEVRKLFGPAVCVQGQATGECDLTPQARAWAEKINAEMGGGHCEGFAVTTSLFYSGLGDPNSPAPFGSETVPGLGQTSQTEAHIAYGFAFQALESVSTTKENASPQSVLNVLAQQLPTREPMVLGVYQPGYKGGHAITPLAVEDRGEGNFAILVYDNNFPNAIREVRVDTNANTWNYLASTNPAEQSSVYEGDASTKTLEIEFARRGLGTQPCSFCPAPPAGEPTEQPAEPEAAPEQTQVLTDADPDEGQGADVAVVDERGRDLGCSGDECAEEIPGGEIVPVKLGSGGTSGVPVWEKSPPPMFRLPAGLDFDVKLDGDVQKGNDNASVSIVRSDVAFTVDDLRIREGDDQSIEIDGRRIRLPNQSNHRVGPKLVVADTEGGNGYEIIVDTNGIDPDATIELLADPEDRRLKLEYESDDEDDAAQVKVVVRRTDDDGDVKRARSSTVRLDEGEDNTLSYSNRALRDGRVDLR